VTDVRSLLDSGTDVVADQPVLALVPFVTSLLAVDKIERVADFHGMHVGLKLPMPSAILDLWTFVSIPQTGINGPQAVPLVLLPVYVAVRGLLAAGYLGAIRDALAGRSLAFAGNVRRYGLPLVAFEVLQLGVVLALVLVADVASPLLLVVLPVLLVVGYLFYGAPYLVVSADEGLVDALGHSYRLALGGGAYAGFFVALLVGGAVLSVVATAVVVNLGLAGVALGAVLAAPVAVAINAAAMALFVGLAGPATTAASRPPDHRADSH